MDLEKIEEIKKKEAQKRYNDTYIEKHKDHLSEKVQCEECGGYYQRYNKHGHMNTIKHKKEKEIRELKIKLNGL